MQESVAALPRVRGTWFVGVLAVAVSQLELDVTAGLCHCPDLSQPGSVPARVPLLGSGTARVPPRSPELLVPR